MTDLSHEPAPEAPDHNELAALLSRLGYTESAAHFHGALCGALCVVDVEKLDVVELLEEGAAEPDVADARALVRLRDVSCADLLSTEMGFEPLLPGDAVALGTRVDALADWCGGFLFGLSSRRTLDIRGMSEEARETLKDLTQFTQAGFDPEGDPEAEENAYAEVVEYVRVGAQLLYLELRPRPPAATEESTSTVH